MVEQFPADAAGVVTVSGRADVPAAVTDSAYAGHMGDLGVPVVMLSISGGQGIASAFGGRTAGSR